MALKGSSKKDAQKFVSRIETGSTNAEDYLELGKLYFDSGDYNSVINLYERALKLALDKVDRATVLLELGRAFETLGKHDRAVILYQESLETVKRVRLSALVIDLRAMCHYNLAINISAHDEAMSHAEEALSGFHSLIDRFPRYGADKGTLYSHMGELYLMLGREDEALMSYKLATENARDNESRVWSLNGMATVYKRLGRLSESEARYRQALAEAKSKTLFSKNYYDLGEVLEQKGQDKSALEAFQTALEYRDDDLVLRHSREYLIDILWSIGSIAYREGDCESVKNYLGRVTSLVNDRHRLYCNSQITLGHCFAEEGNFTLASDHYNKALFSSSATQEEIEVANDSLRDIETEYSA